MSNKEGLGGFLVNALLSWVGMNNFSWLILASKEPSLHGLGVRMNVLESQYALITFVYLLMDARDGLRPA